MNHELFERLSISPVNYGVFADDWLVPSGPKIASHNPATGETIAEVTTATKADYERVIAASQSAFADW